MAENSPYFDHITAARSIAQFTEDNEGSLDGTQLISIESDASTQEQDILVFVQEHFGSFLKLIRAMKKRDQTLLLVYYVLHGTQSQIGPLFSTTQTMASFMLRMAVKVLGALIAFDGPPTAEQMQPIFVAAGIEEQKLSRVDGKLGDEVSVSMSQLVGDYTKYRNFTRVADIHGLHRPDVRRAMRAAADTLLRDDAPMIWQACGAWIFQLLEKANPHSTGVTRREAAKKRNLYLMDPPELGDFKIQIKGREKLCDKLFAPKGHQ